MPSVSHPPVLKTFPLLTIDEEKVLPYNEYAVSRDYYSFHFVPYAINHIVTNPNNRSYCTTPNDCNPQRKERSFDEKNKN